MRKIILIIAVIIALLLGVTTIVKNSLHTSPVVTINPTTKMVNTFSYQGQTGKDALTLLKTQTSIGQDKSGLVTAIGSRKADNKKREFWAFYVNGKMAQVGPTQYQTKDGDTIEWKIEKY
jgi:hypothetical protein